MTDAPIAPKAPRLPQAIEPGTEFIKNPGGAIHDVNEEHAAVALARNSAQGWRLASAEEIGDYCRRHNLKLPEPKAEAEAPEAPAPSEPLAPSEAPEAPAPKASKKA